MTEHERALLDEAQLERIMEERVRLYHDYRNALIKDDCVQLSTIIHGYNHLVVELLTALGIKHAGFTPDPPSWKNGNPQTFGGGGVHVIELDRNTTREGE